MLEEIGGLSIFKQLLWKSVVAFESQWLLLKSLVAKESHSLLWKFNGQRSI
jgi:hypothetical protein